MHIITYGSSEIVKTNLIKFATVKSQENQRWYEILICHTCFHNLFMRGGFESTQTWKKG